VAHCLDALAEFHQSQGLYAEAEPLFQQALEIRRTALGERHPSIAISLKKLVIVNLMTERPAEALTLMEQAIPIEDLVMRLVLTIGSDSERLTCLNSLRESLHLFLSLVLQHLSKSQSAIQASLNLLLLRRAIEHEAFALKRYTLIQQRYPRLGTQIKELGTLQAQIAHMLLAAPLMNDSVFYREKLSEWDLQRERLVEDLSWRIPELSLEQRLQKVDVDAVASALPMNVVLVEFFRLQTFTNEVVRGSLQKGDIHYIAIVMHAEKMDRASMIDLGLAETIDQLINQMKVALTTAMSIDSNIGYELRNRIFDPLQSAFNGQKRIINVSSG
jgi:hypothetical protein